MLENSYSSILKMAIPLMVSTFIQSIVMITDSAFLSRYSTMAFDAAGNGGLIFITLFVSMAGFNDASQIIMARRIGENRFGELSGIFGSTLLLNLINATLLLFVAQVFLPPVILHFAKNEIIASGEVSFLGIRSIGLLFAAGTLTANAFLLATGRTSLVLFSALITAVGNIILDYGLIFGKLGMPAMGLEGAALASTLADGIAMVFVFSVLSFHSEQKKYTILRNFAVKTSELWSLVRVGFPIAFQGLIALVTWTVFFFWIEQIGTFELTVSQTIRSIYFLAFVPIWGFAVATKTYVSQYMGSGSFDEIRSVQKKMQLLSVAGLVCLIHGAFLYPEFLVSIINPNPKYIATSAEVLRFVAGSLFIFGFFQVYVNTISGSGNTRFVFLIEAISVSIYLICAYVFIKVLYWEIKWIWLVEYIYFSVMGIGAYLYLRFFNWRKKVI